MMTIDPDELLRLDQQVCFPLYAASNLLTRLYRPVLAKLGLTYPQYLVMLVLWEKGQQSVGALGQALHLDSGTLTSLLKRLEKAGFVTRLRDSADERRVMIELTADGSLLKARAAHVPLTLFSGLGLSPDMLITLRETIRGMVSVLAVGPDDKPQSPAEDPID